MRSLQVGSGDVVIYKLSITMENAEEHWCHERRWTTCVGEARLILIKLAQSSAGSLNPQVVWPTRVPRHEDEALVTFAVPGGRDAGGSLPKLY